MHRIVALVSAAMCLLELISCVSSINKVETDSNKPFKVNNPNASYFDVKSRTELLRTTKDPQLLNALVQCYEYDCSGAISVKPVDQSLRIPYYYQDRAGHDDAAAPMVRFENEITTLAALYVKTGNSSYANCLLSILSDWAEKNSLAKFNDSDGWRQVWYNIDWSASSAGFAYSIIKDNPNLNPDTKLRVEKWLNRVARRLTTFQSQDTDCCNNHQCWRGVAAAIIGVVSNDDYLFRFGIKVYLAQMKKMNKDGSLPLEMIRGSMAIYYQSFAILPLVYIAEIADCQGYDLYGAKCGGKDIHLAINFLVSALNDVSIVKKYTQSHQETPGLRENLSFMEPYYRKYKNKELEKFLYSGRPFRNRRAGGPSTLYFYEPPS